MPHTILSVSLIFPLNHLFSNLKKSELFNLFVWGSHSRLTVTCSLCTFFPSFTISFSRWEGQNSAQYLISGFTAEFCRSTVVFSLWFSITFLLPNILFVFNNYWALSWHLRKTMSCDPKVSSLNGTSELGTCQYVCIVKVVFPKYIALHLSTLNFICHFITQSLSIVRLFCFLS